MCLIIISNIFSKVLLLIEVGGERHSPYSAIVWYHVQQDALQPL